jgi:hypothetical protein
MMPDRVELQGRELLGVKQASIVKCRTWQTIGGHASPVYPAGSLVFRFVRQETGFFYEVVNFEGVLKVIFPPLAGGCIKGRAFVTSCKCFHITLTLSPQRRGRFLYLPLQTF